MRLRSRLARTRKWRQMCYICHTNAHLATCPVQKLNFGQSVRVAKMSWYNDRLTSEQRAFLTFLSKFLLSADESFDGFLKNCSHGLVFLNAVDLQTLHQVCREIE